MTRTIVSPQWLSQDYPFPDDVEVLIGDDLADVDSEDLARAHFVVLPYMGSSIPLREAIARMRDVEVIQTLTAGFDNVVDLVPDGVTLCNAAGVHDASTAEMALALTLAALRDLPTSVRAQDRAEWVHYVSDSLWRKRVVVVGFGGVGSATYRRLQPFECDVVAVATTARDEVSEVADLPALLPGADVVILTVPLNSSTRGMVDETFIAAMKPGALLVNVARGPVVDTDALVTALQQGRIRAALDVTEPEPLPHDHPLWSAPNTLIAPHLGGDTDAFEPRARDRVHAQWDLWLSGRPLECVV